MGNEFKNINASKKSLRHFGWTMGIILLIILGVLYWRKGELALWLAYVSGAFIILGTLVPVALKPVYFPWIAFSILLGNVMSRVVLSILYFFVLTPLGIAAKLFGKKFLELKWDASKQSYWIARDDDQADPGRYEKQY